MKLAAQFNQLPAYPPPHAHNELEEVAIRTRLDLALFAMCTAADQLGELVMQLRILNNGKGDTP